MFGLTDRVLVIIGGGLAVLLLLALVYTKITDHSTIKNLNHSLVQKTEELRAANQDLGTCRANRINLQSSLDEQNRALEALRSSSATREQELAVIAQRARNDAQNASNRASHILASPGSSCADADRIILENSR